MDPCRRVIGSYRDYVPNFGLSNGYVTEWGGTYLKEDKMAYKGNWTAADKVNADKVKAKAEETKAEEKKAKSKAIRAKAEEAGKKAKDKAIMAKAVMKAKVKAETEKEAMKVTSSKSKRNPVKEVAVKAPVESRRVTRSSTKTTGSCFEQEFTDGSDQTTTDESSDESNDDSSSDDPNKDAEDTSNVVSSDEDDVIHELAETSTSKANNHTNSEFNTSESTTTITAITLEDCDDDDDAAVCGWGSELSDSELQLSQQPQTSNNDDPANCEDVERQPGAHSVLHELIDAVGQLSVPTHDVLDSIWLQMPAVQNLDFPMQVTIPNVYDRQAELRRIMIVLYEKVSTVAMQINCSTDEIYKNPQLLIDNGVSFSQHDNIVTPSSMLLLSPMANS
jgi:hypothetical protein